MVLLADVRVYRDALRRALAAFPEISVTASVRVVEAAPALATQPEPGIALVEAAAARVPAVVRALLAVAPLIKVVAFAIGDEDDDAVRCAEAGVSGYVPRDASVEDLVATIVRVAHGEFPCSPRVAALLARRVSALAAHREPDAVTGCLTTREREILRLIDEGCTNKDIARQLGIEVSTVKNHVHHILDKTGAARRGQAAARVRSPFTLGPPRTPLTRTT